MDMDKYNRDLAFREIGNAMPFLRFRPEWEVRVIWPFGGAAARFLVRKGEASVSVYADFDDSLGCYGAPYWEIYPHTDDTWRGPLADGEGLIEAISVAIGQQEARGIA
jgi:hypothetical protein